MVHRHPTLYRILCLVFLGITMVLIIMSTLLAKGKKRRVSPVRFSQGEPL